MAKAPPSALTFLICDTIIEDKLTNKKSLIGIFSQIASNVFPVKHRHMNLFLLLTDGRGKYRGKLICEHLSTGNRIFAIDIDIEFKNPNDTVEYNINLDNIKFPEPGVYCFSLECDSAPVIERKFTLRKIEGPPQGGPQGQEPQDDFSGDLPSGSFGDFSG